MSTATASNPVLPLAATEGTKVPFIRLDSAFPELFAELMETVERIARESAFTLGPELESFEAAFAEFCGTEYAAGVGSGQAVVPRALRASVQRPTLSHRERQVLTLVCEGLTNSQIAEQLFLSESTVKSHLSSAFAKIGVRSRREAAALFIELEQTHAQGGANA